MRTRILLQRGAIALATLTLFACVGETTSDDVDVDRTERVDPEDAYATPSGSVELAAGRRVPLPTVTTLGKATVLEEGPRWQRLQVRGTMKDIDTGASKNADDEVVLVRGASAIDRAPLGRNAKLALKSDIRASALDGRDEDEDTVYFVHKATADALDTPSASSQPGGWTAEAAGCSNYDKTYTDNVSGSSAFAHRIGDTSGSFTGSGDLTGNVNANVNANVVLRVKRVQTYVFGCRTWAAAFKRLDVAGSASAQSRVRMNGKFEKEWHYSREIAKPSLGALDFWVGPIPVHIGFNLPIQAGLDASAVATLNADMNTSGNATFDVQCNTGGCDGSKNVTFGFTNNGAPSASLAGKVDVVPWVSASVRGYLYSESIVYAQVGVKPKLSSSLFFYAGNQCGDADGDGTPEWVNALTLDVGVAVDVVAKVSLFGENTWSRDWAVLPKRSVAFFDLAPGGSSVLNPMLHGTAAAITSGSPVAAGGFATRVMAGMRPCWPYDDAMSYRVAWGDGSVESIALGANHTFVKEHAFAGRGARTSTLTALADSQNRSVNRSASITLRPHMVGLTLPGGGVLSR